MSEEQQTEVVAPGMRPPEEPAGPLATITVSPEDLTDNPETLRLLRIAAATIGCHEQTALRAALGFKTRGDTRERLLHALRDLGVDVDSFPQVSFGRSADIAADRGEVRRFGPTVSLFPEKASR